MDQAAEITYRREVRQMPYTDPLEPLLRREEELRHQIARRLAEEAGASSLPALSAEHLAAADEAIANWDEQGEEEQDQRAFRPIGPLQALLAEHLEIVERIMDERDRRLG
jgi:hypothetical protein